MKKYYFEGDTPLAFHKFLWYFLMPVSCILLMIRFISYMSGLTNISVTDIVGIIFYIALFILIVTAIYKASQFKSFAWYFIIIFLSLNVLLKFLTFFGEALTSSDNTMFAMVKFVLAAIYATLVVIYYIKRKPLFFPHKMKPPTEEDDIGQTSTTDTAPSEQQIIPENAVNQETVPASGYQTEDNHPGFCRLCGKPIPSLDSQFCKYCGNRIINDADASSDTNEITDRINEA